jgi:VanZ family protein
MLFERTRNRAGWGRSLLRGALLGLGVGTLDELYQRGTPGRESTWTDVAADLAGAAFGAWGWRLRQERRARRPPAGRP